MARGVRLFVLVLGVIAIVQYFVPHAAGRWVHTNLLDWLVVLESAAIIAGVVALIRYQLTEITSGLSEGELIVSSVDITVTKGSGGSGSSDGGGSDDVDIMECMAKLQDLMPCSQKLMEMGEEMGMDPGEYGDEIPWDEIEYWAIDDSGEVPKDVQECLNIMLENRDCLEAMMQMAEDMGIDTSKYQGGMGGF